MKRMLIAGFAALAPAVAGFAQQAPSTSYEPARPIAQVEHLVGDQLGGFRQSCLLVYANGRYHRETRRQEQRSGHPLGDWQFPEVFEGGMGADDLQRLKEIVESEKFRAITGTVGDPSALRSRLAFSAYGVTAHDNVDIFEASLAHPNGSQVFAVVGGTTSREVENSLRSFVGWVGEVEKRKEGRLDKAAADGCAMSSSPGTIPSWRSTTHLAPQPIYTPGPDHQANRATAKHAGTVVVHAIVNADGSVGSVSAKHGIDPVLDRAALDAVRKWKFAPAVLNGMAVPMALDVEISFHSQ